VISLDMRAIPHLPLALSMVTVLVASSACNRTPQDYFGKANREFQQGQFDEASIDYRRAIQKDPRFADAYHKLGMCEYAQGRAENSISALTKAKNLAPDDVGIIEDLADVTFNRYLTTNRPQGLYDSVTAMVNEILRKNPNSPVGLRLLASLQYGDGKIKESIATYRKAEAASPDDPAVILPLVDALRLDNRAGEAEALGLQLVAHKPDYAPIYDWLVDLYISTNRPLEAEKLYRARIKSYPKDPAGPLALAALYRSEHKDKDAKELVEQLTTRADFPNRYLLAGDFYAAARDVPDAERCYKAGIVAEPAEKSSYLTKLAVLYAGQKRTDEALQTLSEVIREHPDDWEAQGIRISLLLDAKDPAKLEEASTATQAILKKNPTDSRFAELLGRAYQLKGDTRKAEVYFQQAAHYNAQFAEPRIALAEYSKMRRDPAAVLRYTEEVLRVNPRDPHARLLHAWALMNRNDLSAAEREMQALDEEFPNSFDVRVQMGLEYIAEKRTKAAVDLFTKLLEAHPGDQRVLAGLATAYFQGHSFDTAIQFITREVQKNPNSESSRALLARIALRLGKPDLALQQFKILAEAHPQSAEYQNELGGLYEYLGDKPAAVRSFEAAAKLLPADADAHGRLALAYYAAGMLEQADAAYSRSLKLNPADPALLNNRAYFLAETGNNPDEALRMAQNALLKAPESPGILDTLALSYVQKKMGDNAVQILQRLVISYPNEPIFRYHLAMALMLKGDKAAARKQLEESLTKHPSKDDVVKIRALLSRLG
jgi:tetratricopeptide (TPR) repeat protein